LERSENSWLWNEIQNAFPLLVDNMLTWFGRP
jgi:hypothetical protein